MGIAWRTLQDWRCAGKGPKPIVLATTTVRYTRAAIREWQREMENKRGD